MTRTLGMPLVHQACRTLRNRADGNPFATLLNEMAAAYAKAGPRAVPSEAGRS